MSFAIAPGELLKERYRLRHLLGRGGMAAVWLGHDEVLDRPVAVKVLSDTISSDPEFVARFRREARTAAGVTHPNLVGVYDYGDGEERPYLVMQFVPGEDLGSILARNGRVDCERLARELLDAVAHIHAVGIVHRDIKPANILIDEEGTPRLIDFGIAQPADATALTRTGLVLGTERYAAPEVMEGRPATERSDLYSCGVVLRSCLGEDYSPLRSLVAWLTSSDSGGRPASARQALARLERIVAAPPEEPTQAFEPLQPEPGRASTPIASPGPRHRRWAAALGLLAVVVATSAVVIDGAGDGGSPKASSKSPKVQRSKAKPAADRTTSVAATATPEGSDPALGSALNQEGFELIQAGEYESAVPILKEAVRAFPSGTDDINYAYALFNLGNALRLSGRAEEAIPVLEQRLRIPDQTATVRAELDAAEREAG